MQPWLGRSTDVDWVEAQLWLVPPGFSGDGLLSRRSHSALAVLGPGHFFFFFFHCNLNFTCAPLCAPSHEAGVCEVGRKLVYQGV